MTKDICLLILVYSPGSYSSVKFLPVFLSLKFNWCKVFIIYILVYPYSLTSLLCKAHFYIQRLNLTSNPLYRGMVDVKHTLNLDLSLIHSITLAWNYSVLQNIKYFVSFILMLQDNLYHKY